MGELEKRVWVYVGNFAAGWVMKIGKKCKGYSEASGISLNFDSEASARRWIKERWVQQ